MKTKIKTRKTQLKLRLRTTVQGMWGKSRMGKSVPQKGYNQ
jgi:hypothetical protein